MQQSRTRSLVPGTHARTCRPAAQPVSTRSASTRCWSSSSATASMVGIGHAEDAASTVVQLALQRRRPVRRSALPAAGRRAPRTAAAARPARPAPAGTYVRPPGAHVRGRERCSTGSSIWPSWSDGAASAALAAFVERQVGDPDAGRAVTARGRTSGSWSVLTASWCWRRRRPGRARRVRTFVARQRPCSTASACAHRPVRPGRRPADRGRRAVARMAAAVAAVLRRRRCSSARSRAAASAAPGSPGR